MKSLNIKRWTVGRSAWCQRMGRPGKDFRQVLATQTGENDGPRLVMMIIIIILGKPSQIRWIFRDSPNGLKLLSNEDEQIIRIIIRQIDDKNDIINKKWFIPCSFRDLSVLVQPADIVSKFRKQLKNVRSHKDFLLGWSIHFSYSVDQYIANLIRWSIHCQLLQIVMWFTTGQDVSTSDLNGEIFYDSILSYHDVWYIIMWWRYRIESICDKNYEQSSIHWKHLLPMIK